MFRLIALLATLAVSQLALAAPPTEDSVRRLLELTKVEGTLAILHSNLERLMRQSLQQAVAGKLLTPEQQKVIDLLPAKLVGAIREELAWSKLEPSYIAIYQETFDQEEIDALVRFYESPAGQAVITKMPLVLEKSIAAAQTRMQSYLPKLKSAMAESIREAGISK